MSGSSHAIHDYDGQLAARVVAHLDVRVATKCDLHKLRMKFSRDNDIYVIYIYTYEKKVKRELELFRALRSGTCVSFDVLLIIVKLLRAKSNS